MIKPRFPLFVVSYGRCGTATTPKALDDMGVDYTLVVEASQTAEYEQEYGADNVITVPEEYHENYKTCDSLGREKSQGPGPARNFVWDYSQDQGHDWHWVMDDNIRHFYHYNNNEIIKFADPSCFRAMEDFVLQYKNIAMAGPNYEMFVPRKNKQPPLVCNTRIYSCNLIRNDTGFEWRGRYNEDTIMSLDMLKKGWCTVQFNKFLQDKEETQQFDGGNTENFYKHEGTYPKSRMLKRCHPDVTKISKKFGRWHHHVSYQPFKDTRLIKKDDSDVIQADYDFKTIANTD